MKHEIGISQPGFFVEDWPGKYEVFSWLEYVVTVPNPIFLITTYKENGKPNANLHSWGFPVGDCDHFSFRLVLRRFLKISWKMMRSATPVLHAKLPSWSARRASPNAFLTWNAASSGTARYARAAAGNSAGARRARRGG